MDRPLKAIILAGTLRPSPLREELDVHVLCLPIGEAGSLLDAWLAALGTLDNLAEVTIVVNTEDDVEAIQRETAHRGNTASSRPAVRTTVEPAAWRGVGGILRDVTGDVEPNAVVVAAEAHILPPPALSPIAMALQAGDENPVDGAVGVRSHDEPAGVYAFTGRALALVPPVGYYDVKEQLLPSMNDRGMKARVAPLEGSSRRLRDRRGYLIAVQTSLGQSGGDGPFCRISPLTSIADSAVIEGSCIVEPGVMILDEAVVHDSVLLKGATIGRGAVISSSIVGPLGAVAAGERAIRTVVTEPGTVEGRKAIVSDDQRVGKVA